MKIAAPMSPCSTSGATASHPSRKFHSTCATAPTPGIDLANASKNASNNPEPSPTNRLAPERTSGEVETGSH